jgi:NADPH-dependent 2,4-dienoyl-CoA reductase/sulfur reductase-like enzyme
LVAKENGGVAVVTGHRVVKLDIPNRKAHLDNGMTVTYDKCLIATGKLQLQFSFISVISCGEFDGNYSSGTGTSGDVYKPGMVKHCDPFPSLDSI